MVSMQQWQYMKNKKKTSSGNVTAESYANTIFEKAFEAPFITLEQAVQGKVDMTNTWTIVGMAAYLQERVCIAWGKLNEKDLDEGSSYYMDLKKEKEKLDNGVSKGELTPELATARYNYFKLAKILEIIQSGKGRAEELEV